jgi:hypothetical protein
VRKENGLTVFVRTWKSKPSPGSSGLSHTVPMMIWEAAQRGAPWSDEVGNHLLNKGHWQYGLISVLPVRLLRRTEREDQARG